MAAEPALTIAQLARQSGVKAGTLRMWETRYGFPRPARTESGRRLYTRAEAELVERIARDRASGVSLPAAIERALGSEPEDDGSLFSELRRLRPDLDVHVLSKPAMRALSFAIEDECRAQAVRPVLFGYFQRERFYRQSEHRWRDLERTAEACFVFADFEAVAEPEDGPVEIPLDSDSPAHREWSVVCDSPRFSACLAGWERPGDRRAFESIWSVEPEVVRHAALLSHRRAQQAAPEPAARAARRLEGVPGPVGPHELRVSATLTSRMAAYLSAL
jgi:DICT domain-containing protein/transposase-like protein